MGGRKATAPADEGQGNGIGWHSEAIGPPASWCSESPELPYPNPEPKCQQSCCHVTAGLVSMLLFDISDPESAVTCDDPIQTCIYDAFCNTHRIPPAQTQSSGAVGPASSDRPLAYGQIRCTLTC
ncbi:hypothetical protein KIL84_023404 [Mauremys mutica]|uniref:Uncharacterized protein n=1 Tax=Mauremys mutica TaxID=74926 RepID=A0A9D3WRM5_9SAUR|nr:hypothetical protein KIL84_023404 [Mauremys mutica]